MSATADITDSTKSACRQRSERNGSPASAMTSTSGPSLCSVPARLYPSRPFKVFLRVGAEWKDRNELTLESVWRAAHTAALVSTANGTIIDQCPKCCPFRSPLKLGLSSSASLGPYKSDPASDIIEFCFDSCRTLCHSSRLHFGGKVQICMTFCAEDGRRVAEARSQPLELCSKAPRAVRPQRLSSPSRWEEASFDYEECGPTSVSPTVELPGADVCCPSGAPSAALPDTEPQGVLMAPVPIEPQLQARLSPPPSPAAGGSCSHQHSLAHPQLLLDATPMPPQNGGVDGTPEGIAQLSARFAMQTMQIVALEMALDAYKMMMQPSQTLLPAQSQSRAGRVPLEWSGSGSSDQGAEKGRAAGTAEAAGGSEGQSPSLPPMGGVGAIAPLDGFVLP